MNEDNKVYDFLFDPEDDRVSYYWQLRFLQGARSVLDIGCSTGFFDRYLVERGAQVVGIESDPNAAEKARTVCYCVIEGDIESQETQSQITERFDAVLLGDVLEHLRSPEKLLKYIRENWLNPEGRVVISIPNSGHWIFRREVLKGRFPYRKYGLFDHTHLRFYNRRSLLRLVEDAGYRLQALAVTTNFNSLEDITFDSIKFLYRYRYSRWVLNRFEFWLAKVYPQLFAYQYVLCLQAVSNPHINK